MLQCMFKLILEPINGFSRDVDDGRSFFGIGHGRALFYPFCSFHPSSLVVDSLLRVVKPFHTEAHRKKSSLDWLSDRRVLPSM